MTKAIRRAFDDRRQMEGADQADLPRRGLRAGASGRRALSVVKALEWAFATEQAALEFDQVNPDVQAARVDPIYRMMRQAELGCRVDGGGTTARADDAEVIASIVARLPPAVGGKAMAVLVAHHARACSRPDPMCGAVPRLVPRDGWRMTKHGDFARTEVVGSVETIYRGRKVLHDLVACPVTFRPSASQISASRRAYLDWWGALLHLRHDLAACGLATLTITDDMPPMQPWCDPVDRRSMD